MQTVSSVQTHLDSLLSISGLGLLDLGSFLDRGSSCWLGLSNSGGGHRGLIWLGLSGSLLEKGGVWLVVTVATNHGHPSIHYDGC